MSDDDDTEGPEYGLVMPFVPVQSKGGPHDDAAYVAGYEMGKLDAELASGVDDREPRTIRSDNREQADLIAMRHGYVAEIALSDVDGWAYLRLRRAEGIA